MSWKISAPVKITLIYLLIGMLWIFLSDRLVAGSLENAIEITHLQTLKGTAFILTTSLLLYSLVRQNFASLQKAQTSLEQSYDATLAGWAKALDLRDHSTEEHTTRVADLTVRLAKTMGIEEPKLTHIRRGAILHDIGKIGIPDHILLKPGQLSPEDWAIMRQHPIYAFEMLKPIAHLQPSLDIPFCHHEKWNGTGYPRGLKGEEIPLAARIFAVVDVWDALTSSRPYREAWTRQEAIEYIQFQAGHHFDPAVVKAFIQMMT
ncbi:MAG: hypothetical protein Fur0022_16460 [Anaerolineales bacterium]